MSDPIRCVIGYDKREASAVWTLANSLLKRSRRPISFTFLYLPALQRDNLMWRERDPKQSTDFSYSRFLTPYLTNYKGQAIWMDCDMVAVGDWDVEDLLAYAPMGTDVACVKHDYRPANKVKFAGAIQEGYPKKLWSSLMVFNCYTARCQHLTPKFINEATGKALHQFLWTIEPRIAEIPEAYNWIPGHSNERVPADEARLIHYTEGGPSWKAYENAANAESWWAEYKEAAAVGVE